MTRLTRPHSETEAELLKDSEYVKALSLELDETVKELERLRTELAELKTSLGLPDEITAEPSGSYEGLLKQFSALKALANGKCRMASHWSRMVDKLTREAMLNNNDAINSERDANAMLTDALEQAESENAELKAERDRLCITVKDLSGAMLSVNRSRNQKIMIEGDDEPCYWQREEWVKWIVEIATRARDEA